MVYRTEKYKRLKGEVEKQCKKCKFELLELLKRGELNENFQLLCD